MTCTARARSVHALKAQYMCSVLWPITESLSVHITYLTQSYHVHAFYTLCARSTQALSTHCMCSIFAIKLGGFCHTLTLCAPLLY